MIFCAWRPNYQFVNFIISLELLEYESIFNLPQIDINILAFRLIAIRKYLKVFYLSLRSKLGSLVA